jgi:hypothetical protein
VHRHQPISFTLSKSKVQSLHGSGFVARASVILITLPSSFWQDVQDCSPQVMISTDSKPDDWYCFSFISKNNSIVEI